MSDVSFLRYPSIWWIWRNELSNILRLFQLGSFELFWRLESHCIIMTGTLWHYLLLNACFIAHMIPVCPLQVHFPPPPLTLECMTYLNLDTGAPLHYICALIKREPIISVHWPCKHDVCSIISDLYTSSLDTGSERYKARESFLWIYKSSQMWVIWSPWRGRKGMSSHKPHMSPFHHIMRIKRSP